MSTEKINILYYEPTSGYGGSSRCLLAWLKSLNKKKYNPVVVVHSNGPAIQKIRDLGVRVIDIPFKQIFVFKNVFFLSYPLLFLNFFVFYVPTALLVYILAKTNHIGIFHLNAKVISSIPAIIAAKISGITCICHLHDIKIPVKREKFFGRWVNCFIVLTEKAYELYNKEYPHIRLELIQNGIDLNDYKFVTNNNKLKVEFGIKDDEAVIGIVGRLVEGKGFSDFIKAAKIISSKNKSSKFIIVGGQDSKEDDYENSLIELVAKLELKKNVVFTGWREDVKKIMSIFDILVQASSSFPEGFGLTVVEAMALGKPIVVTDVPGPSEIVIDGETGYIVPPSNPEKLADAMEKLIDDRKLALIMGKNGRKRVEEYFNLEIIVSKLDNLYTSLLKKRDSND